MNIETYRIDQYNKLVADVAAQNVETIRAYGDKSRTWQDTDKRNRANGLLSPRKPQLPLMVKVLPDDGSWSFKTQTVPFPDLKQPEPLPDDPPAVSKPLRPPGTPDEMGYVVYMLEQLNTKFDTLLKKLGPGIGG